MIIMMTISCSCFDLSASCFRRTETVIVIEYVLYCTVRVQYRVQYRVQVSTVQGTVQGTVTVLFDCLTV